MQEMYMLDMHNHIFLTVVQVTTFAEWSNNCIHVCQLCRLSTCTVATALL